MKLSLMVKQFLAVSLVLALGVGCGAGPEVNKTDGVIGAPLGKTDALQPGLTAYYTLHKYRNIDEMPPDDKMIAKGAAGKPILGIDHNFNKGYIFDSGASQAVGLLKIGRAHV